MAIEAISVQAGQALQPDGWRPKCSAIEACDWEGAPWRVDTGRTWLDGTPIKPAIRVEVTGRKVRWIDGRRRVRVRITWVGDGEPDSYSGGWLWID